MLFNPAEYQEPTYTGGVAKMLNPGTHFARIVDLQLTEGKVPNQPDGRYVQVTLEGPAMGGEFEGLQIDKNNQALGRYQGQIAQVRNGQWPFSDFTTKGGEFIPRDQQIFNFVNALLKQMGRLDVLIATGRTANTIEEYVELAAEYLLDASTWGLFTLAGDPYQSEKGHTNYRLSFPKLQNGCYAYVKALSPEDKPEKFIWFNEAEHIAKPRTTPTATTATVAQGTLAQPTAGQPPVATGAPTTFAQPATAPKAPTSPELDQLPF